MDKQILFTQPYVAELAEVDSRPLAPDEIRVKTVVSTISNGTERANLVGDPNVAGASKKVPPFPRALGYSSSGVVVEKGSEVSGLEIGDRVVMSWSKHTSHNRIKAQNVAKITDDSLTFEQAAMLHIATFPLAAIRKVGLELGESLLVMGLGILGLMAVQLARVAGAAPVIAVDPNPARREMAIKYGADYAFDPFEPDFAEKVKKLTGNGVKAAIEVTGVGAGLDGCLDCMARFGRVALLGCTRDKEFTIDYYKKVHAPGITLVGAHTMARPKFDSSAGWFTERDDINALLTLCSLGRLDFEQMIEETHSPAECREVYNRLANDKAFPTVVQFDWRRLED